VDNGIYKIKFSLYTAESGGTAVWSEVQDSVNVSGGVYSTALGIVTPMTAAFDQTYYLGVKVGTGAEMTPRALLSSAPYALSLIGENNQVPSTGTVKVGGAGTDDAKIEFKKGANTASITYDGTNISIQNLIAPAPPTPANLVVTSKLAVGQAAVDANNALVVNGTSFFSTFVEIGSFVRKDLSPVYFTMNIAGVGNSIGYTFAQEPLSLKASNTIAAPMFATYSDRRIKKDLLLSNTNTDLSLLQKLRVTDYRHVDVVEKGTAFRKGFIAQEVKETFPEAVTTAPDFIPDVYALSTHTRFAAGQMTISLEKNHGFAVGDEVKLIMPEGEKKVIVAATPSENAFAVAWDEAAAEKIFVYGKKVKDFHTVDYDRIFTLNVSATQELARKVEALEKENAGLRQQVGELKTEAKASADKTEARFRALENRMAN
jgi:hypothetical protein